MEQPEKVTDLEGPGQINTAKVEAAWHPGTEEALTNVVKWYD